MTHPPKLSLAETAIWWGSPKPYNAGRLWVTVVESLDWTIVEVTLGLDSQRPVHGPCELKCCERTPEDKTYDIYLTHGRVQWESLHCGTMGSWDSGRDLGQLRGVQREGLCCGTTGSWDSVYRSGTDSVVRGHWMSYLQMVWGMLNVYVLYVYSTEPVLSAELC